MLFVFPTLQPTYWSSCPSLWLACIAALSAWLLNWLTTCPNIWSYLSACLTALTANLGNVCLCVWKPDCLNFCLKAELRDCLSVCLSESLSARLSTCLNIWILDCAHLSLFPPTCSNSCLSQKVNHINWQENGDERTSIIDNGFILAND